MSNLPTSGVQLVAQGAAAYIGDINKAAKATDDFAKDASAAASKVAGSADVMGGSAKKAGDLYQDEAGRWRTNSGRFASDAEKAAAGVASATGKMAQESGGHFNALGEIAVGVLRKIGEVALTALGEAAKAAGQFLKDSVTSAADVEQTLNVMGATSGATAAQLDKVRDAAIALGGDLDLPATSAQDASQAMLELTKAGFTVDEAMAAAKGTLQLAAAAEIDAGTAAQITAQAINAFGLEASDAAHIADLLAGGANASSASMTDLSQGLQQGGFAFDAAGQSVDDLVVSVAALTNVGLTGSDAGTALKNAMMRLMNPTDKAAGLMQELGIQAYDANGKMKPWPEVLENIRAATAGMSDEQRNAALGTIFLSDGMKAMIPLLDMSATDYANLTAEVTKAGSAQTVAGAQTVGFNGAIAGLQSQMETLQLIIGTKLLPLLTPFIQQIATAASSVGTFVSALLDADDPIAFLVAQFPLLGTAISIINTVVPIAEGYLTALATTATTAFDSILAAVNSVMPFILAVVSSVLAQVLTFWQNNGAQIMAFLTTTWATVNAIISTALQLIAKIIQGVLATIFLFIQEHGAQIQQVLTAAWNIISNLITAALAIIQGVIKAALAIINGDWNTAWTAIKEMSVTVTKALFEIIKAALNIIAAFMGTSLEAIGATWSSNFQKMGDAVAPYMKIAQDAVTTAIDAIKGAFGGIASAINGAIDAVKKFIDAASKIKVPSLVTPGSPTPLEIGMTGIADATKQAATAFTAQLSPALNMVAMPAKAVMGATTNNNQRNTTYQMPIYTNQSPSVVRQSLAVVEAMNA